MAVSYPTGAQDRSKLTGARWGLATVGMLAFGLLTIADLSVTGGLVLFAGISLLGFRTRRFADRARRNRIGKQSEDPIRRALLNLAVADWRIRSNVPLPWGGNIDHTAVSPCGRGFVIETKTRAFTHEHLVRTMRAARWAAERCREYPGDVAPVLCVVRSAGLQHYYGEVLIVSVDQLVPALRSLAAGAGHAA